VTHDDLHPGPPGPRIAPMLSVILLLVSCTAATPPPPVISAKGGEIRVSTSGGFTAVDVTSSGGIGSAALTLPDSLCRQPVVFRFHLRGLEQFVLAYGTTRFEVSLSSSDLDRPPLVTVLVAGTAVPDAADDPRFRIDISAGDPITISAPADFTPAACGEFTLSWVDFFRR